MDRFDPYAGLRNGFPPSQQEDPDGQVDGDVVGEASPFATSMQGSPWLGGMPPWHLWGNTQRITTVVETTGAVRVGQTGQLVKIAYKRPETWHWVFAARLLSGPANTDTFFTRLFVRFQVTIGVGRSVLQMFSLEPLAPFDVKAFERYVFQWGPVAPAFPRGALIYTTQAQSPPRSFMADGPFPEDGPPITQIVAQDIQVDVQLVALTIADNVAAVGQPVAVEVSAHFSPKTHVRPDWLQINKPDAALFAGDETGGK